MHTCAKIRTLPTLPWAAVWKISGTLPTLPYRRLPTRNRLPPTRHLAGTLAGGTGKFNGHIQKADPGPKAPTTTYVRPKPHVPGHRPVAGLHACYAMRMAPKKFQKRQVRFRGFRPQPILTTATRQAVCTYLAMIDYQRFCRKRGGFDHRSLT